MQPVHIVIDDEFGSIKQTFESHRICLVLPAGYIYRNCKRDRLLKRAKLSMQPCYKCIIYSLFEFQAYLWSYLTHVE